MSDSSGKLKLGALVALVVGSMIGGGIFSLPQNMAASAGVGAVLIGWGITAVGMLTLAFVFQTLANRKPELDSGVYAYAKAGFGDYMGFSSAWGYWISAWIGNVSYMVLLFSTLGYFFPVFGTGNARLFTQHANGFQLTSQELQGLLLDSGHFTSASDSNSSNHDGALKALYAGVETRSVDYLGGRYALSDQLSVSLYGSEFKDIWRQYYANTNYSFAPGENQSLNLDFNLYRTDEAGQSLAGKIDNTTWSLAAAYQLGVQRLTLAYQQVDGNEPFDYLGFDRQPGTSIFLANSIQIVDFNAPNERSWQLRYDLDMAAFGVPGLSFMSRYVNGDHIDDSHYDGGPNGAYGRYGSDGKRWERDIEARYVVQSGKAKDLSVRIRQASLRSSAQVARADTTDNNEVRVIIEYPLNIL